LSNPDGRTVIITGASSGIGAALALRLAGRVSNLVLHARRSRDALAAVAQKVAAKGSRTELVLAELGDEASPAAIVGAALNRFGAVDALVANAGFATGKSLTDATTADINHAFGANLFSFLALARQAHGPLKAAAHPRIVAIGSFTAHVFRPGLEQFPVSAIAKGGLETAVRALAAELSGDGITVNCVVPGYIRKDDGRPSLSATALAEAEARIPLGRIGRPDEVAAAIAFLLSRDAGYITGQNLHVNGGLV